MAGEETDRIYGLWDATRKRLEVTEQQIAQFGERWAPQHLLIERKEMQETIASYEKVLGSIIPTAVTEDLGPAGRFIATQEDLREIKRSIALLGRQLGDFILRTDDYRGQHAKLHEAEAREAAHVRKWQIAAAVAILIVAAFIIGRII